MAFEKEKMTPVEIAEDQGLELESVKAGLMQCSSLYRKQCGAETKEGEEIEDESSNFSREQLRNVTQEIYSLAMGTEDEHVKKDLLKYIRNDAKGRLNPVKNIQHSGINILTINMALQKARVGAGEAKKLIEA